MVGRGGMVGRGDMVEWGVMVGRGGMVGRGHRHLAPLAYPPQSKPQTKPPFAAAAANLNCYLNGCLKQFRPHQIRKPLSKPLNLNS